MRAYRHLHDLDRLCDSPLIHLPYVQRRVDRTSALAEARALRSLLVEEWCSRGYARQAFEHAVLLGDAHRAHRRAS